MLTAEEARDIVEQNAGSRMFDVLEIHEIPLGSEDGGYMSEYWRIEIRVRLSVSQDEKTYKFFAKAIPQTEGIHRDFVLDVHCYEKETGFYKKLVPLLKKYSDGRKNYNVKSRWAPACYLARDEIIVMEDLCLQDFKVFNNRAPMDLYHCIIVMKELANFHAASIIFEEKEKNNLCDVCWIGDMFPDIFTSVVGKSMPGDPNKGFFPTSIRAFCAIVPFLKKCKENVDLQRVIQANIPKVCQESVAIFARSNKYRNVVCHGDMWSSNMLFRYEEESDSPSTVRFVDFQLVRYAPPASDIVMFIHTTTRRDFRERHFDQLLNVYYNELRKELKENGLSPEQLLSFEELKSSCENIRPAGRVAACLYFQAITITKDQRKSIFSSAEKFNTFFLCDRETEVRQWFLSDDFYREWLEEAIDEFIEEDILKNKNLEYIK